MKNQSEFEPILEWSDSDLNHIMTRDFSKAKEILHIPIYVEKSIGTRF